MPIVPVTFSPLTTRANNASHIRFRSYPPKPLPPHGFEQTALSTIHSELKRYHYGVGRVWLEPTIPFQMIERPHSVMCRNIWGEYTDSNGNVYGLCGNLARHTLNALRQNPDLKNYRFDLVCGKEPRYFNTHESNHVFILGTQAKTHDALINRLKQQLNNRQHANQIFTIPDECLVIDPSFGYTGNEPVLTRYQIDEFLEEDKALIYGDHHPQDQWISFAFTPNQQDPDISVSTTVPVGFLGDLVPSYTGSLPKNTLISMFFTRIGHSATFPSYSIKLPRQSRGVHWETEDEDVPTGSPLDQITNHVFLEMQKPSDPKSFDTVLQYFAEPMMQNLVLPRDFALRPQFYMKQHRTGEA